MPKKERVEIINWYRTPIPKDVLAELNERSDGLGFLQAVGHLACTAVTAGCAIYGWYHELWIVMAIGIFLHGTVAAFYINAVHELVHGTVFRTAWLNDAFCYVFAFLGLINHKSFWTSHTEHHKYTLHPPDDLEVVISPHALSLWPFLRTATFNIYDYQNKIGLMKNVFGTLEGEWAAALFPEEDRKARAAALNWSRIMMAGHLLIDAIALWNGVWIIPILLTFPVVVGNWLQNLCNATQHVGLQDNVPDFRLCCRTIYLDPISQFLYWHMNYHIEHHMYAAVPCYKLGKLHRTIKHDLPHTHSGLMEAWTEIGHIMYLQKQDPNYRFVPKLPQDQNKDGEVLPEQSSAETATPTQRTAQPREVEETGADQKRREEAADDGLPLKKWECSVCGFIYDEARGLPEDGIAPGTRWEDIPDDWNCPDCGIGKADFTMVEMNESRSASRAVEARV